MFDVSPRRLGALVAVAVSAVALSACGAGSLGSSDNKGGGKVTLAFLADNSEPSTKIAEGLAKEFTAKNPDITVNVESRPQGGEGDNLVKTRLQTGDMTDVFMYNSGSLFQQINPQQNLLPLDDQPWVGQLDETFKSTVTSAGKVYGAPFGTFMGGAVLYSKPIYEQLGLQVPKTWAEFMANNEKIKAAGKDPVIQTYGDTWTSQLFVLGDFHNVAAAEPDFAEKYTKNQAKYATSPAAIKGFQHQQEVHDKGFMNKDFASAKLEDGLRKLAKNEGAHYPILSAVIGGVVATDPKALQTIGLFALPGDEAAKNGLTVWSPAGVYIPKTTEGAQLDAAKKFLAFIASPDGCAATAKASAASGPLAVKGCELPADVPQAVKDMQPYFDSGNNSPALEFLSPVKGPALEQITVEVGSGIRKAAAAAALYDQDVKKQAQQLGLEGW
jgi:raffinose/stachyose/melibiose transport system substrate-binding protein